MTYIRCFSVRNLKNKLEVYEYYTCKVSVIYAYFQYLIRHPYVSLILWKVKVNKALLKLSAQTYEATDFSGVREYHLFSKWQLIYLENSHMSLNMNWCKWIKELATRSQIPKKSKCLSGTAFLKRWPVFLGLGKFVHIRNCKWIFFF